MELPDSELMQVILTFESTTHPLPFANFQLRRRFSGHTSSPRLASPPLNLPISGPIIQSPRDLPGM